MNQVLHNVRNFREKILKLIINPNIIPMKHITSDRIKFIHSELTVHKSSAFNK